MTYSIAVIGSGMAGLAAAYRARNSGHSVTLFEAQTSHGMDAHALNLEGGLVDTPLRVMSPDSGPFVGSWTHEGVPLLGAAARSANAVVEAINQASSDTASSSSG